jgi:hypothetical protein
MAIVANPYYGQQNIENGTPSHYIDTATGNFVKMMPPNEGDPGYPQDTGVSSGISAGSLKMLGAGYTPYEGLQGVFLSPDGQQGFLDPTYAGNSGAFGWAGTSANGDGVIPLGSVANSAQWVNGAVQHRKDIYTGSTTEGSFWDGAGPVALAGLMAGGVMMGGAAGAAGGADAMGNSALQSVYGTGAGGFGAPLSAYEAAMPISAGIDAAATGSLASLTGTAGLTPLADAASAGTGFNSSVGYGVNAPADGITSSLSELNNTITPQVAGTTDIAPNSFSNNFNINDPSTWPNISTPDGTGYTPTTDVPTPNLTAPTTDVFGNPLSGQTYNLANSGTGMTNLDTSIFGGNNQYGNWIKNQLSSPTSSLKNMLPKSTLNADGSINWGNLASSIGPTAVGAYTADQIRSQQNQLLDMGAPARNAMNSMITNPDTWYNSGPAKGAAIAASNALSAKVGNVANNPGATAQLAANQLGGYNQSLSTLANAGNIGLGKYDANASANTLGASLAGGLASLFPTQATQATTTANNATAGLNNAYMQYLQQGLNGYNAQGTNAASTDMTGFMNNMQPTFPSALPKDTFGNTQFDLGNGFTSLF